MRTGIVLKIPMLIGEVSMRFAISSLKEQFAAGTQARSFTQYFTHDKCLLLVEKTLAAERAHGVRSPSFLRENSA